MAGFLVIYEPETGDYQVIEYSGDTGQRAALQKRLKLESERRFEGESIEITALSADSLDSIKKTHARYFKGRQATFIEPD
ncbi:hypothetical protein [Nocardia vaccinii]|uniref:hypothetical protein n=1 Tax=Nocardia vaccinii TaxID=1822 RepID=UPI0012F4E004|nr:hypothetical protein [Nocardia vaccinii]